MKTVEQEFEIDFIGEQTKLTMAEEKALSAYFKQKKENLTLGKTKIPIKKTKTKSLAK